MLAYIIRRLLLIIPTLFGIMVINFVIIQAAPGGPIEQMIAQIKGQAGGVLERVTGAGGELAVGAQQQLQTSTGQTSKYRGAQGIPPELIKELEQQFGFDKPAQLRFIQKIGNFLVIDFGESFFRDRPVVDLVIEKMPVSISIGLWTTLLTYLVSIPLGIAKAVRDGSRFDIWSSAFIIVGYAIPGFLFAILLIVLFAGGSYLDWFPLRGLVSENWRSLPWPQKILDYFWHIALPVLAMVVGGFASLAMLTKNSFLDQINQQYV
ncbi:MAG: ABC transporter permease subunit, partial [Pseudomonadota bacterium]